jgi:hypothetical protein
MDITNIDEERINDDIIAAGELLNRLGIAVETGCPCGCLAIRSHRTGKVQSYHTIDEITYLNVLGFAGPAFRQLVTQQDAGEVVGQTTLTCFLEAVAIVRSCCVDDCTYEEEEEDDFDDIG